jgi:hypothetical protein
MFRAGLSTTWTKAESVKIDFAMFFIKTIKLLSLQDGTETKQEDSGRYGFCLASNAMGFVCVPPVWFGHALRKLPLLPQNVFVEG